MMQTSCMLYDTRHYIKICIMYAKLTITCIFILFCFQYKFIATLSSVLTPSSSENGIIIIIIIIIIITIIIIIII